jgi:hypothetical protein
MVIKTVKILAVEHSYEITVLRSLTWPSVPPLPAASFLCLEHYALYCISVFAFFQAVRSFPSCFIHYNSSDYGFTVDV